MSDDRPASAPLAKPCRGADGTTAGTSNLRHAAALAQLHMVDVRSAPSEDRQPSKFRLHTFLQRLQHKVL